jgi:hypothetical protein
MSINDCDFSELINAINNILKFLKEDYCLYLICSAILFLSSIAIDD